MTLVVVDGDRVIERYYKETRAAGDSVQFGQPAASWAGAAQPWDRTPRRTRR